MHDPDPGEPDRLDQLRPELRAVLAEGLGRLEGLARGPADGPFSPEVPRALAAAGLRRLVVPLGRGGLGAGLRETALVLAALGARDGSAALGLAMHSQIIGGALQANAGSWPLPLLRELIDGCASDGGWAGTAAAGGDAGSPLPGVDLETTAVPAAGGTYRLDGQRAWLAWLPSLHRLLVTAAVEDGSGLFLLDPLTPGLEIEGDGAAFALRGSGSGRLRLRDVAVSADRLVSCRPRGQPDPRGPAPRAWFGVAVAAVYLGIGEGGRAAVAAFAGERQPSDARRGLGPIPSLAVRLGHLDATLRVARLVVLETARRWDATPAGDAAARQALLDDVALAKVTATNAAVSATDEALRICGGPGLAEGPLERAFRDARAGLIHPPLDDICYQSFAGRLLGASED